MLLLLFAAYAALVVVALIWGVAVALSFKGTLSDVPLPDNPPRVSCIVPARNEARNIGTCLEGLTAQTYPDFEIIIVDDASSDATPDILREWQTRDTRLKVVNVSEKPADWNGKQNACYQGYLAADGDLLCFMDADTHAEPDLLRRTVAQQVAEKIDLLTLQPWYVKGSFWERVMMPPPLLGTIMFVYPPFRVNNPQDPMAIANGQFLMLRRTVYEATGGHAAVRNTMMDDFPLAEVVKGAGYRLFMADGSEVMRVRMYHNLGEIWAGMLKLMVMFTGGWLGTFFALLANLVLYVLPVVMLGWALALDDLTLVAISGGLFLLITLVHSAMSYQAFKIPLYYGILFPVGGLMTTGVMLDGMLRFATGRNVRWKGRELLGVPGVSAVSGNQGGSESKRG